MIDFQGRVAIVTGAGGGLGRAHALALARRGAKVVVNDFGGARDGTGGSATAAQAVVDEIRAAGGQAIANHASVTDFEAVQAMVQQAMDAWGRVDILVNNAGVMSQLVCEYCLKRFASCLKRSDIKIAHHLRHIALRAANRVSR